MMETRELTKEQEEELRKKEEEIRKQINWDDENILDLAHHVMVPHKKG